MKDFIIIGWRIVLACIVLVFFGYVFEKNIPFSGKREINYTFGKASGEVAHLRPFSRVTKEDDQINLSERILEEPVYLDIYSFLRYHKAHITLWFSNSTSQEVSVGIQRTVHADTIIKSFEALTKDGEWTRGSVSYDVSEIPLMRGGYILVFSIPGLSQQGSEQEHVRVSRIRVVFEGESLLKRLANSMIGYKK